MRYEYFPQRGLKLTFQNATDLKIALRFMITQRPQKCFAIKLV